MGTDATTFGVGGFARMLTQGSAVFNRAIPRLQDWGPESRWDSLGQNAGKQPVKFFENSGCLFLWWYIDWVCDKVHAMGRKPASRRGRGLFFDILRREAQGGGLKGPVSGAYVVKTRRLATGVASRPTLPGGCTALSSHVQPFNLKK